MMKRRKNLDYTAACDAVHRRDFERIVELEREVEVATTIGDDWRNHYRETYDRWVSEHGLLDVALARIVDLEVERNYALGKSDSWRARALASENRYEFDVSIPMDEQREHIERLEAENHQMKSTLIDLVGIYERLKALEKRLEALEKIIEELNEKASRTGLRSGRLDFWDDDWPEEEGA